MDGKYWGIAGIFLVAIGCSQSSSPSSSANSSGKSPVVAAANSTPDQAVFEFLEAVRTGNDAKAAAMLTPLARQKTAEADLVVAPPGSPTAKFKVAGVEYITPEKDGAHVWSTWSDTMTYQGPDGQQHTESRSDDYIWVLRLESEGWRIVGTITKVFPDQPPLVLDFEDPADMLRKKQLLQEGVTTPAGEAAINQAQQAQPSAQPQAVRPQQPNGPAAR